MRFSFAACALVTACATASTHSASPLADSQRLVVPQVRRLSSESTYDLVARIRPFFLHARAPLTRPLEWGEEMIGVYVNGMFVGGVESLKEISADNVYSVRRISMADAGITYGRQFRDGALEVTLLRR